MAQLFCLSFGGGILLPVHFYGWHCFVCPVLWVHFDSIRELLRINWEQNSSVLKLTWDSIYVKMVMLKNVTTSENGRGTDAGGRLSLSKNPDTRKEYPGSK